MSRMFMRSLAVLAILGGVFAGCNGRLGRHSTTPEYQVHVDALKAPAAPTAGTYALVPGTAGVAPSDLQFREHAEQVKRVMGSKGFTEAASAREAQLLLFVAYGLGRPQVSYDAVTLPALGLVQQPEPEPLPATDGGVPNAQAAAPSPGAPPVVTRVQRTHAPPRARRGDVEYERYVALSAVDTRRYLEGGELNELWRVTVTSTGYTSDLRVVLPVLIAGARNAIATDTGSAQSFWIRDDDPRVAYVRGETGK